MIAVVDVSQWGRELATKPDDPHLVPRTHVMDTPSSCALTSTHIHTVNVIKS